MKNSGRKIRGKTISYASYKKKQEREELLQNELRVLEECVDDKTVQRLEEIKLELEEIRKNRMEGVTVRSKVRWLHEGEKVSRYVCNLESRNFVNKLTSFLETDNADIISDQNLILEEVTKFYENLYSHRETADVDH